MIQQMTQYEKNILLTESFEKIWNTIWCDEESNSQYKAKK